MTRPIAIGVRELVAFVHRRGDIHVRYERHTSGPEGLAAQRRIQQDRGPEYVTELRVEVEFEVAATTYRVSGRVDGCDLGAGMIEEFKATRADIDPVHEHLGHLHLAQLKLYAGLLARSNPQHSQWQLYLCYLDPDPHSPNAGLLRRVPLSASAIELERFLVATLATYQQWLQQLAQYREGRDQRLESLCFPFADFRENQRAVAARAYQTMRDGGSLLLEAATGTGKTLAMLFPAYKALAGTLLQRLFFLTSRSTGQAAVERAAEQLDSAGAAVRSITIIAREKACPVAGMPCNPVDCERAHGYYDRVRAGLTAALAQADNRPERLRVVAAEHNLCPFELSLDVSMWSDLVVMDYNYLFDPTVRLQRFAQAGDAAVLIDESHQLSERVRAMLSVEFPRASLIAALVPARKLSAGLYSAVKGLRRSFAYAIKAERDTDCARAQNSGAARSPRDLQLAPPDAFNRRLPELLVLLTEMSAQQVPLDDALQTLLFTVLRWRRAQDWLDVDNSAAFYLSANDSLQMLCLDPAKHISSTLANYGPNLRFSGTLSPMPLYRRLQGIETTELARSSASYSADALGLFIVPDVPTYYRARNASMGALVELVNAVISARAGNYFVAFPSFAYLAAFTKAFALAFPAKALLEQRAQSDLATREAFVARFRSTSEPLLGCVVLGGIFTESIDFAGDALIGVVVVGVALPPPTVVRDAIAAHFGGAANNSALGQDIAYRQPAMVRVVQAAGRVLRGGSERGVVCLVDGRFLRPEFAQFQPVHWHPKVVSASRLETELNRFWNMG